MIRLENVTKYYPTRAGRHYVLNDVSFSIPQGAQMGVLGRNGAGKSTLLRLIGGVDVPNAGRIIREGRISWPLGIGAGIQSSMTGRENARFCCRIQGLRYDEIADVVEQIRQFAELGKFFDLPTRTYSSGMKARLKFAMAMSFPFDCYIIDELSAVGDAAFKKKSRQLFQEKRARSSFIRVSHRLEELLEECNCGVVLEAGELSIFDTIEEAVEFYRGIIGDEPEPEVHRGGPKWKKAAEEVLAAAGTFEEAATKALKQPKSDGKPGKRGAARGKRKSAAGTAKKQRRGAAKPASEQGSVTTAAPAPALHTLHRPAPMAPRSRGN